MKIWSLHYVIKQLLFAIPLSLLLISSSSGQRATPAADKPGTLLIDPEQYNPDNDSINLYKTQLLGDIPPTTYRKEKRENGDVVIRAQSDRSASGLVIPVELDPAFHRYIRWEWKVDSVLENGDMTRKDGDDFAARIYITFDYDKSNLGFRDRVRYFFIRTFTSFDVPLRALNYVWANKADIETIAPSPYIDWVYLVAAQSGNERAGEWVVDTRDILKDYRSAFGEDPPAITGISIMTDSDNTESTSEAYYGRIWVSTSKDFPEPAYSLNFSAE